MILPDGLRSLIVTSYGRSELTRYAESLLEAIKLWRQAGAWRSKREAIASKKTTESTRKSKLTPLKSRPTTLNSSEARNVISFIERVSGRRRSSPPHELERRPTSVGFNARSTSMRR
jgi:hypothetical protein